MLEPLFLLELVVIVVFGMVGGVFATTAGRVARARGLRVLAAGIGVTVLLFAVIWWLDAVAGGPDTRVLVTVPAVLMGTQLSRPLRARLLAPTPPD